MGCHKQAPPRGALRPRHCALLTLLLAFLLSALPFLCSGAPDPDPVTLNPASEAAPVCEVPGDPTIVADASLPVKRVWKGWGVSLTWSANYYGAFPEPQLKQLMDMAFSPTLGLGLNIVRYNIGGGLNPKNSPNIASAKYAYRAMEGFKPDPKGPYNWDADPRQRKVLFEAKARGVDQFVAYSNSPPWWMTISGDVAGGRLGASNLSPSNFQAFADYLADVVQHYVTVYNIPFQHLEPFNEPGMLWMKGYIQEGNTFNPPEAAALIPIVQKALKKRTLTTQVVAFDDITEHFGQFFGALPSATVDTMPMYHMHAYKQLVRKASRLAHAKSFADAAALIPTKEIWQTEWGPLDANGTDTALGLFMARTIIQSINLMRASAWCYWQFVDTTPEWALVYLPGEFIGKWNYTTLPYKLTKKYFTLEHFSRLVPPGSYPLDLQSENVCQYCSAAFYVPCRGQVVYTVVNQQSKDQKITFQLKNFQKANSAKPSVLQLLRTSRSEDFNSVSQTNVPDLANLAPFTAKGFSLTSIVITNVVSMNSNMVCNS